MIIIALMVIGLCLGSGINYLADTLPWKRKIDKPFCLACQAEFPWQNYFIWPRKCASCGSRRDWGVYLTEVLMAITITVLWFTPPEKMGFFFGSAVLFYFGLIIVIDMRYKLILHSVSIAGAILGFVVGIYTHGIATTLWGGLFGYGVMFCFYKLGEVFIRFISKRRGELDDEVALGFGDVNLSGVLGLMVGFPGVVVSMFMGALIGGFFSLIYLVFSFILRKYKPLTALPYGPFLISGAVLILFFVDTLDRLF